MANFTDFTGLAGVASAIAASLLLLPGIRRLAGIRRAWATGAVVAAALIPLGGMPLAAYVRGATGDLSITTLVLLWCALLRPWTKCEAVDLRQRIPLLALVALTAVAFYPMALGFGTLDPYRLGYANGWFVTVLMLIALSAWVRESYSTALCISLAVLAWAVGWYESTNLWDYLLDPFVSIYALSALLIRGGKRLKQS